MVSDSHSERPVLIDLRNLAGSRDRKRQACRLALRCRAWPDDEQTLLDAIHHYRSAGKKRIRRPGAVVGRCVVPRKEIKEPNLAQYSLSDLACVEHPQTTAVVRFVYEMPANIEVVIDRRSRAVIDACDDRRVQVRHIPDPCARRMLERRLVAFVVDQKEPLILGKPPLVGVRAASIARSRKLALFELVRCIYDSQSVFVGVETDFTVAIDRIRPLVDDALRFVRVAVKTEAPSRPRRRGRAHVNRVQTAFTGSCAGGIRETSAAIHRE